MFKQLKKDTTLKAYIDSTMQPKIRRTDVLSILISSLNKDEDLIYNSSSTGVATSTLEGGGAQGVINQNPSQYIVDSEGNIRIHHLGEIHAEGLSTKDLKLNLEKSLAPYLRDPIVTVTFANHHVIVLGGVQKPVIIPMSDQPLTLLEAIAAAGDIIPASQVNDVMIIRDSIGVKQFKHLNLESVSFMNSPWYYLHQNDIVYINSNAEKKDNDDRRIRTQQIVAIATSTISILVILLDRIIK